MTHLVRAEDVTVGTELYYLGRTLTVDRVEPLPDGFTFPGRVAVGECGRSLTLRDGWTVWAKGDQ